MAEEKLDRKDLLLLELLKNDSKITFAEIARSLKLSRAAITKRVNALIARGVIDKFTVLLNPKELNLDITVLFEIITLPINTAEIEQLLIKYQEVGRIMTTGTSTLLILAYFRDSDHLNGFLEETLTTVSGVQEIKTNIILKSVEGKSLIIQ